MPEITNPKNYTWKTVKVFISSTFRDMHAERDHLVKVVFPALREKLEKYRIRLIDIDLRWGVTQEQAENNQVLDVCLKQIEECRPFFIGILGERYGFVPHELPMEVENMFDWLKENKGKSLTELEILQGVLLNPAMKKRAFFYFRDPGVLEAIDNNTREIYVETNAESLKKIDRIKRTILENHLPVTVYSASWDDQSYDHMNKTFGRLTGLELFGKKVEAELWDGICNEYNLKEEYDGNNSPDAIQLEAEFQNLFIDSRTWMYTGRDEINKKLMDYLDGTDNHILILSGSSGSGKSSILARLFSEYSGKNNNILIIPHFVGASPNSTDIRNVLLRICSQIKETFKLTIEIPEAAPSLMTVFRSLLITVPEEKRLVILIDGIDQLDETDHPEELAWLPELLPNNVRIILSCISEPNLTSRYLTRANESEMIKLEVSPLTIQEKEEIIRQVPSLYAKCLDKDQINRLIANPATANPLFLLVALEELRGFGSYEALNDKIDSFPQSADPFTTDDAIRELFIQVIERLEMEFNPQLIRTILTHLACARRGLSESELKFIVKDIPSWEEIFPVMRQLRPYLMHRGEIIDFYHRGLWKAINSFYLLGEEVKSEIHRQLARMFSIHQVQLRKIDELPWQLTQAKEWEALKNLLSELHFFEGVYQFNRFELQNYWVQIETYSKYTLVESYKSVIQNPLSNPNISWLIANLLDDTAHYNEAFDLFGNLATMFKNKNDWNNYAMALQGQAHIVKIIKKPAESLKISQETEKIFRSMGDHSALQSSICQQGFILRESGYLQEALMKFKEAERICMEHEIEKGLAHPMYGQGLVLKDMGLKEEALEVFKKVEHISNAYGDKSTLANAYCSLATLYRHKNELDTAMKYHLNEENVSRAIGNKQQVGRSLGGQAIIYQMKGDFEKALSLHKEEETIATSLKDNSGLAISLANQANLQQLTGNLKEALHIYKRTEKLWRELNNIGGLVVCLQNQVMLLIFKLDREEEALPLAEEVFRLVRDYGLKPLPDQFLQILKALRENYG